MTRRYEPLGEDELIRLVRDLADEDLTAGPWRWIGERDDSDGMPYILASSESGAPVLLVTTDETIRVGQADRKFIAWARMLVPRLVETVRMREARVRVLEALLKRQMEETARDQGTELPRPQ